MEPGTTRDENEPLLDQLLDEINYARMSLFEAPPQKSKEESFGTYDPDYATEDHYHLDVAHALEHLDEAVKLLEKAGAKVFMGWP